MRTQQWYSYKDVVNSVTTQYSFTIANGEWSITKIYCAVHGQTAGLQAAAMGAYCEFYQGSLAPVVNVGSNDNAGTGIDGKYLIATDKVPWLGDVALVAGTQYTFDLWGAYSMAVAEYGGANLYFWINWCLESRS